MTKKPIFSYIVSTLGVALYLSEKWACKSCKCDPDFAEFLQVSGKIGMIAGMVSYFTSDVIEGFYNMRQRFWRATPTEVVDNPPQLDRENRIIGV